MNLYIPFYGSRATQQRMQAACRARFPAQRLLAILVLVGLSIALSESLHAWQYPVPLPDGGRGSSVQSLISTRDPVCGGGMEQIEIRAGDNSLCHRGLSSPRNLCSASNGYGDELAEDRGCAQQLPSQRCLCRRLHRFAPGRWRSPSLAEGPGSDGSNQGGVGTVQLRWQGGIGKLRIARSLFPSRQYSWRHSHSDWRFKLAT